ncbi:MAG: hypothetical protein M3270_00320 [Thermoproteota archaeon]|nr:hypothetical protein [Thermoproteota archaeon]
MAFKERNKRIASTGLATTTSFESGKRDLDTDSFSKRLSNFAQRTERRFVIHSSLDGRHKQR